MKFTLILNLGVVATIYNRSVELTGLENHRLIVYNWHRKCHWDEAFSLTVESGCRLCLAILWQNVLGSTRLLKLLDFILVLQHASRFEMVTLAAVAVVSERKVEVCAVGAHPVPNSLFIKRLTVFLSLNLHLDCVLNLFFFLLNCLAWLLVLLISSLFNSSFFIMPHQMLGLSIKVLLWFHL